MARLRFAVSPLWEVATSFRLLRAGRPHPAHRPWVEQVRPRVAAAGLERLAELVPADGYVPDFLNPAPPGPDPALAEELAAVRSAPVERIRRTLGALRAHRDGRRAAHPEDEIRLRQVIRAAEARGLPTGRAPRARVC
ncbi:DUF5937 family protein [Streptomyces sp. NPDC002776]